MRVLSLEAREDLIAGADGTPNPDRPNWTTIRQDGAKMGSELVRPEMTPLTVRNANRYGAMATKNPSISSAGALNVPAGGSVKADDYYTMRE